MSHRDILETNNCKVVYTYTKVFQKHVKYEKLKLLVTVFSAKGSSANFWQLIRTRNKIPSTSMIGDNSDNYCHSLSKTLWTAKRDTLLSLPFNVCNVIEYLYSAFSVFIKSHSEALPLQLAARSASEALLAAMMPLDWKMISKIHWDGNNEFAALEKIWS